MINNELQHILNLLEEATKEDYINIWIPSLQTAEPPLLQIKPLTINQQKLLIKSSLNQESILTNYNFTKQIFDIINTNIKQPLNNIELNILDKLFIILNLRSNINDVYIVDDYEISLKTVISNITEEFTNKINLFNKKFFKNNNITVYVNLPSIQTELLCEEYKYDKLKNLSIEQISDYLHEFIVESLADELAKFIYYVEISGTVYDLFQFNYSDKKSIIEKIPTEILSHILQYIADYKKIIEDCLTITSEDNKETNYIKIDGSFFSTIQ